MRAFVGVTGQTWFERLRRLNPDDINFWRPSGQGFRALRPGVPFLFKLHAPWNVIAGGGFFVEARLLPVSQAWLAFEERNGVGDAKKLPTRTDKYRRAHAARGPAESTRGVVPLRGRASRREGPCGKRQGMQMRVCGRGSRS